MLAATPTPPVLSAPQAAASDSQVTTGRGCYRVGQRVAVSGTRLTASAPYDLSIGGVDFGQAVTDPRGDFRTSLLPGGLGAGQVQARELLTVRDGTHRASTGFTLTRPTGALFGSGSGTSPRRTVPFQVWDLAPTGARTSVYLHYLAPSGALKSTVALGRTSGQCGALSARHALFPFNPVAGTWTLQFDTSRSAPAALGLRARLRVFIG